MENKKKAWINAHVHSTFSEHVQLCRLSHHFPSCSLGGCERLGDKKHHNEWPHNATTEMRKSTCWHHCQVFLPLFHLRRWLHWQPPSRGCRQLYPKTSQILCSSRGAAVLPYVMMTVTAVTPKDLLIVEEAEQTQYYNQDPSYNLDQDSRPRPTVIT